MPPYETDLFWIVVFWLTIGLGTISCVAAAIVLAIDFLRARDPEPQRTAIKDRIRGLPR